jgi:hypothetical protein
MSRTLDEVLDTAMGRRHRPDPVAPRTGGPSGNARITAWLGLLLLVLFVGEVVTLLDVRGLITWHLDLGLLLIPPALAKTASTGWRIVRYYSRKPLYVAAGPPALLLRLLGPLVVLATSGLLSTGVALIVTGPSAARQPLLTLLGQSLSLLTLHQVAFIGWAAVTGLHVLARLVPAWHLASGRATPQRIPGRAGRAAVLVAVAVLAALVAVAVVPTASASAWQSDQFGGGLRRDRQARAPAGPSRADVGQHRRASAQRSPVPDSSSPAIGESPSEGRTSPAL